MGSLSIGQLAFEDGQPVHTPERYFMIKRYLSIIGASPAEAAKKTFSPKAKFFFHVLCPVHNLLRRHLMSNKMVLNYSSSDVTETEIHVKVRELRKPSNRKFIGSGYKVYLLEV